MTRNLDQVIAGFQQVLEGLGIETNDHTRDTALRAGKAWFHELCGSLGTTPPKITTFSSKSDEMIVLKDIPVRSVCAHHLLPFFGTATVAYIPGAGKIIGLSKLSRLTEYWCRRPQVQEELTADIANAVAEHVMKNGLGGVGVAVRANHMCMMLRGVRHEGNMVTSALRGAMKNKPEARAEFLALIR